MRVLHLATVEAADGHIDICMDRRADTQHHVQASAGAIGKPHALNPGVGMQGLFNNIDKAGKGFLVFKVRQSSVSTDP